LVVLIALAPGPAFAAGSAPTWGALDLLERTVPPGERLKFSYSRGRTFTSAFLDTPVFAARGTKSGPTLCLTALVHGDERNGFEVVRKTFAETDPRSLSGTLIGLPAVNAHGLRTGSRYMPDRRDLNREFPGSRGSNSAMIADLLFSMLRQNCDAVIDLHTGSLERANLPQIRVDLSDPGALTLAKSFGASVIVGGAGPRGSLRRELMTIGIPTILYEAGLPQRFQPEEIARGVEGVRNAMIHLGMLEGRPTRTTPANRIFSRTTWLRVPVENGGVYYSLKQLGDRVAKGEAVARVEEPFTDESFLVDSDVSGTVIGMAVPQIVFPGYAILHIAQP
jgi:predicted deacylase